jgi:hypothetical protein
MLTVENWLKYGDYEGRTVYFVESYSSHLCSLGGGDFLHVYQDRHDRYRVSLVRYGRADVPNYYSLERSGLSEQPYTLAGDPLPEGGWAVIYQHYVKTSIQFELEHFVSIYFPYLKERSDLQDGMGSFTWRRIKEFCIAVTNGSFRVITVTIPYRN